MTVPVWSNEKFFRRGKEFFCLFLLLFSAAFLLQGEEPDLAAGDQAFAAKDYAVAASFYTRHLQKMKKADDPEKIREAYERLMDSLLFGKLAGQAEKILHEYLVKYPGVNPVGADMWKGKLLMLKGKTSQALQIFEKILSHLPASDPGRFSALSAYAEALEAAGRYKEAAAAYDKLLAITKNLETGKNIAVKLILSLIRASDFSRAEKLLTDDGKNLLTGEKKALLYAFMLLRKDPEKESCEHWKKILSQYTLAQKKVEKDPLLYLVAAVYADLFLARGNFSSAMDSYRLACYAAGTNEELFKAISGIIKTVEKSGNGPEAAALAEKQLQLFRHTMVDLAVKKRTADLLQNNGRLESAAKLHESIFGDIRNSREVQMASFRQYLLIKLRLNQFPEALSFVRRELRTRNRAAEGEMLAAEVLEKAGKKQESMQIYISAGKTYPAIAAEAFYKALLLAVEENSKEAISRLYILLDQVKSGSEKFQREKLYFKAVENILEGKTSEAEKLLDEYLKVPGNQNIPEALSMTGMLALGRKDYKKAQWALTKIIKEYPDFKKTPLAAYWLIHIYFMQADEQEAEKMTLFLAEKYPSSTFTPTSLLRLCRIYTEQGAYQKASRLLERLGDLEIVKQDPASFEGKILCAKSILEEKLDRRDNAIKILEEVVKKYPQGPVFQEACCRLGEIYCKMNDLDKAVNAYTKAAVAAGSDPLLTYAAQGALGNILLSSRSQDMESLQQALECFTAIAGEEAAPADFRAEANYKAGRCLELLGRKQEADLNYKQLLYAFPAEKLHRETLASVWCVKAAEKLIDSAVKTPILSAFENARFALHYLHDAGLLTRQEAEKRFDRLKELKFKP